MYNKFGFCKYREHCRRQHYKEVCESNSCKSTRSCPKRHPKVCKRFAFDENCRFDDCAYKHLEQSKPMPNNELHGKMKNLENMVKEMALKIKNLETEIIEMKNKNSKDSVNVVDII